MVSNPAKGRIKCIEAAPDTRLPENLLVSSTRTTLGSPSSSKPWARHCHKTEPPTTSATLNSKPADCGCLGWCSTSTSYDEDCISIVELVAPTLRQHKLGCKPSRQGAGNEVSALGERHGLIGIPGYIARLSRQALTVPRATNHLLTCTKNVENRESLNSEDNSWYQSIKFSELSYYSTLANLSYNRSNLLASFVDKSGIINFAPFLKEKPSNGRPKKKQAANQYRFLSIYWLLLFSILLNITNYQVKLVSCKSIEDQRANSLLAEVGQPAAHPDDHLNATSLSEFIPAPISSLPLELKTTPAELSLQTSTLAPIAQTTHQTFDQSAKTTLSSFFETVSSAFTKLIPASIQTTPIPSTTPLPSEEATSSEEDDSSTRDDDYDAESCEGLSANGAPEAKNLTDSERLVNLQTCLQKKVKKRLLSATRAGMEVFEKLSLSGGCASSLMTMASSLSEIKSFAFKFIDASAKIPSGVMYGLLSDYGDFDQCLSIRSNPLVKPEDEVEENSFSGKYCLLSVKLNYHIELSPNSSAPEGIIADGVLWDELVRNYWTSKSSKGFQVGVCVPSRCTNDDLDQIYKHGLPFALIYYSNNQFYSTTVTESYNIQGEVMSCQDSIDLNRQQTPDTLQLIIINGFFGLVILTIIGTFLDRYIPNFNQESLNQESKSPSINQMNNEARNNNFRITNWLVITYNKLALIYKILVCFSIRRNWLIFISNQNAGQDLLVTSCRLKNSSVFVSATRNHLQDSSSSRFDGYGGGPLTELTNQSTSSMSIACSNPSIAINPEPQKNIIRNLGQTSVLTTNFCSSEQKLSISSIEDNSETNHKQLRSIDDRFCQPLTVEVHPPNVSPRDHCRIANNSSINHLSGLKLMVIMWITIGHSFLYPSANNYQYYRSIINIKITRDSVWFATTNFTLGIDMLLYMAGLVFVYKLARFNIQEPVRSTGYDYTNSHDEIQSKKSATSSSLDLSGLGIIRSILRKVLRFWPTYLAVIALAIVVPLVADGPMWPEMVSKRLGSSCRKNFWANLLVVNNFFSEPEICLPSSWFISVLMQLILVGSIIIMLARRFSLTLAASLLTLLLIASSAISFAFAYYMNLRAPVIRMDESFVMELDDNIFKLYTNVFNNLGPFLVGIAGGLILLKTDEVEFSKQNMTSLSSSGIGPSSKQAKCCSPKLVKTNHFKQFLYSMLKELVIGLFIAMIAIAVLSSVFYKNYTRLGSSIYWATHRIGWAIVTGYMIHQCATGKWRLLYDMLSLSTFIPLSKLVVISYLVYPIFIYLHSGFVRDGLHVSIYNMMNIYLTRLVLTFIVALFIHLLIELPFCSLEELLLSGWVSKKDKLIKTKEQPNKFHPLLAVAPIIVLNSDEITQTKKHEQTVDA